MPVMHVPIRLGGDPPKAWMEIAPITDRPLTFCTHE